MRRLRHWLGGRRVKVNKCSPASSRLSATARCSSLHLRMKDEGFAARFDLLRRRVDHVGVVGGDLVMQPLGGIVSEIGIMAERLSFAAG